MSGRRLRELLTELNDVSEMVSGRNVFNVTINYNGDNYIEKDNENEIIENEIANNVIHNTNSGTNSNTIPNSNINTNTNQNDIYNNYNEVSGSSERTIGTIHISSNLNPEPIIYHNTTRSSNISEISNEISNFINTSITSLQRSSSTITNTALSIQLLNEKTEVFIKNDNLENLCPICNENFQEDKICRKNKICNHFFHMKCIDRWYSDKNTCPECNQIIN